MSEVESLRTALKAAIIALDDWTNTYAPEFCDEERVKQAQNRLTEHGTLYYIATVVKQCSDALKGKEMNKLKVYDMVSIYQTGDLNLDDKQAQVVGFYGIESHGPLGVIIQPIPQIQGFDPCIVMTPSCLMKV